MTLDDLKFTIQVQKELEFEFNGKVYILNYDKASDGHLIIVFGRQYEGIRYDSYGEFINNAKIDNYFFRELLDDIKIL